jgi:cytidine deaminase
MDMNDNDLVKLAIEIRKNSYSPYSKFRVGAALITGNGKIYTGVNIENASFGATCCAERTAIFKAVSEGENTVQTIAVAADSKDLVFPCGICRQVISEFADENLRILCSRLDGEYKVFFLQELLPHAFLKSEVLERQRPSS